MSLRTPQTIEIAAELISVVSVRIISLILVLLGIVLLIANGGPP